MGFYTKIKKQVIVNGHLFFLNRGTCVYKFTLYFSVIAYLIVVGMMHSHEVVAAVVPRQAREHSVKALCYTVLAGVTGIVGGISGCCAALDWWSLMNFTPLEESSVFPHCGTNSVKGALVYSGIALCSACCIKALFRNRLIC